MEDLEILDEAIGTWLEGDTDNRHIFSIMGDKKMQITSNSIGGKVSDICSAIVNEMLSDEEVADILTVAVDTFNEMKEVLEKEVEKETKIPTKKYLS